MCNVLVDTGATISLVSSRIVYLMNLELNIRPTNKLIAGLGKKIIPMRGEIVLSLQLGKASQRHIFVVSDNLDSEILMGMDLMKKFNMCINVPHKLIQMPHNNNVTFINKPVAIKSRMKIRCNRTIKIPAKTACYINGKIPVCNTTTNYEGIIEPYKKLAESNGIFVTGSISYSNKNLVPIHCINPMPWEVTVYKNQLLAFIEPFQPFGSIQEAHVIKKATDFYDASINVPRLSTAEPVEVTREKGKWDNPENLIKQLKIDKIDVSENYRNELKSLITEFSHCFSRDKFDLGCASFYEARLTLKRDFTPKWVPTRQTSYKMQPFMDQQIENLEKSGQISKCRFSIWNLPVFLAVKPNSKSTANPHRFLVDARALNSQVIKDNYELPRINNILDKMTEGKFWSNFDLTSSFTQIGLEQNSRHLTAFTYNQRRYMFNRMIQGAINSSAEFSRAMGLLFESTPFSSLCFFIDDLLMASNTEREHIKRLRFMFQRLEWGNLKCNPNKTNLMAREVNFVGHTLSEKGLQVSDDKIQAIKKLPPPINVKSLQSFLGMLNYHRNHIQHFAQTAAPLYNLLQKNAPFNWDDSCHESWSQLRTALMTAPILGIVDYTDKYQSYIVTIDSSKAGHGATLTQWDGNQRRIVAYFSKSVPKHQQKLGATKLEMLGLLAALKHWRILLHATPFIVKTDCVALLSLQSIFHKENSYMQRRLAMLAGFTFKIQHISGKSEEIKISDYLSRWGPFEVKSTNAQTQTSNTNVTAKNCIFDNKINDCNAKTLASVVSQGTQTSEISTINDSDMLNYNEENICQTNKYGFSDSCVSSTDEESSESDELDSTKLHNVLLQSIEKETTPITLEDVRREYFNDKILLEVIDWVKINKKPINIDSRSSHCETFHYWKNFNQLTLNNGILYINRINANSKKTTKVIVLPYTLIERVLYSYHNTISNCHPGAENSYELCMKRFYFYKMRKEFELWVNACLVCNRTKQAQALLRAPLRPIIYNHPFQAISIDHLEVSKTPTPRGITALLNITDMFTGYLVCIPVKSQKAEVTIQKIIEHWILRFGMFNNLHHDLGAGFTSKLFQAILKVFNIKDKPGSSFSSKTQGKIESMNRRLNIAFRSTLSDKDFKNYDLYAKYITFVLNALKSSRTGHSAYYLVHGHEPIMPRDLFINDNRLEKLQSQENVSKEENYAYQLYKQVRDVTRSVIASTKQRVQYMATQYDKKVKGPFFEVGQYCFLLVNVPKHKYSERWTGPYLITHKINNWNYIIQVNGIEKVVNIEKLKHYKISKYSNINGELEKNLSTGNSNNRKSSSVSYHKPSDPKEDSESDDDIIISIPLSTNTKLDTYSSSQAINNNGGRTDQNTVSNQGTTPTGTPINVDQQEVQMPSPSNSLEPRVTPIPVGELNNDSSAVSTPASSINESENEDDDQEAFYDASTSLLGNEQPDNQPSGSGRNLTLPDIDKHGKKKGVKVPLASRELSRSEVQEDLTADHRSNARYGLRPRVTGVKKYGFSSPVKTLKKKITKTKSSKK